MGILWLFFPSAMIDRHVAAPEGIIPSRPEHKPSLTFSFYSLILNLSIYIGFQTVGILYKAPVNTTFCKIIDRFWHSTLGNVKCNHDRWKTHKQLKYTKSVVPNIVWKNPQQHGNTSNSLTICHAKWLNDVYCYPLAMLISLTSVCVVG